MNKFLVMAALCLGAQAAQAKDIAQSSFNHEGVNGREIDTLTVTDNGSVRIERQALNNDAPALPTVYKKLSKEVFEQLSFKIQQLSTAELVTTRQTVVCMMMPMLGARKDLKVARDYDFETQSYQGELTLVLSQAGCWLAIHTAPKEAFEKEEAKSLVSALEILGLTYVAGK
jgi:hypothetical protein